MAAAPGDVNFVYKIFPNTPVYQGTPIPVPPSWEFPQTDVDVEDCFIHLSTAAQLPNTLTLFFGEDTHVQLLKIDYKRLSSFKIVEWEKARNGDTFPHLYAQLEGEYVKDLKVVPKPEGEKGWEVAVEELKKSGFIQA